MELSETVATVLGHKAIQDVISVTPEATVYEAIKLMDDRNIGVLLVMEGGELQGLLSERDYTRKVMLKGRSSKTTPVRDIMTERVICVRPKAGVMSCLELMAREKVRHLPVVEGQRVRGVVSIGDLVKCVISTQGAMIDQLENYILGGYPG